MSDYILNANVSYSERKINVSALYTGSTSNPVSAVGWIVKNPKGVIISSSSFQLEDQFQLMPGYYGTASFGLRAAAFGSTITSTTGIYFSDMLVNWKTSDYNANILLIETGLSPNGITISQRDNIYSGVPVLITRGDSVLQTRVDSVAGGNYIAWNCQEAAINTIAGTFNYNNSIVEVLSGSNAGQIARITSYDTTGFYVDRDVYSWSGNYIKVMPRRWIKEYTPWSRPDPTNYSEAGTGDILAEFKLSEAKPTGVGFAYNLTGQFINNVSVDVYQISQGVGGSNFFNTSGTTILLQRPLDQKDVQPGDVLFYYANEDSNQLNSGVVLQVRTAADADISNEYYEVTYFPSGRPASPLIAPMHLHRADQYSLELYPEFDQDYSVHAYIAGIGQVGYTKFRTPSAEIEFSANEHESTYGTVGEQAHFHIGPVRLSNGEYLNDSKYLTLSGTIEQGDVTNPTVLARGVANGSQNPNIGHNYSGSYYKDGVYTISVANSFNASETLFAKIQANYGSAVVTNVITLPVQPSV